MLNWRRLPSFPPSEYPHYETVIKDFWQELEDYKVFIQEHIQRKLDPHPAMRTYLCQFDPPNEIFANEGQLLKVLPPAASFYDIQTNDRQFCRG